MDEFQKVQRYFDKAKINYYTGSIAGLQELILQTTGDYISINAIKNYILLVDSKNKPTFLQSFSFEFKKNK